MARLLSLNVGLPQDIAWQGRTVHTGIFKYPVDGPRMVRTLDVEGDGQGDLGGHGGEIRAVLVYQRESYEFWRQQLGREDLEYGRFGENFTVDGLPDDEVHIGDRYRIGEAGFSKRDVWWLHTARSAADHAFAAEVHRLLVGLDRSHEHVYYTAPTAEVDPPAVRGRLNRETLAALGLPATATTYLCGPSTFMDAMRAALIDIGMDADRIRTELFGALPAINPGLTEPPTPRRTSPRGRSAPVLGSPSLVAASPQILSGSVTYRTEPLEPPAGNTTLICCSQPETDVVLAL